MLTLVSLRGAPNMTLQHITAFAVNNWARLAGEATCCNAARVHAVLMRPIDQARTVRWRRASGANATS